MEDEGRRRAAEVFAHELVHHFWGDDAEFLAAALDEDFLWIAAQDDQYLLDRRRSLALYRGIMASLPDVVIVDEDYTAVISEGGVTVVVGSYYGLNNPDSGTAFSARQRMTLVLRDRPDGSFGVVHMHVSNPVSLSRKGEYFPVGFSREAYRYVRMLASHYSDRSSVEVREIGGATHVLRTFDVVYLEADRQYTMVHCLNKTLRARQGIGALSKLFPESRFLEVRRGSVVNVLHILSWNAEEVVLTGGVRIPIPARRSTEVRERIEELRRLVVSSPQKVGGGG